MFFALILLLTALACSHLHVCVRLWKVGKCTQKTGLPHRGLFVIHTLVVSFVEVETALKRARSGSACQGAWLVIIYACCITQGSNSQPHKASHDHELPANWKSSSVKEDVKLEEGKDTIMSFKIGSSVHNKLFFKDAPIATDCDWKGWFLNPGKKTKQKNQSTFIYVALYNNQKVLHNNIKKLA